MNTPLRDIWLSFLGILLITCLPHAGLSQNQKSGPLENTVQKSPVLPGPGHGTQTAAPALKFDAYRITIPTKPSPGAVFPVNTKVKNDGDRASGVFYIKTYLAKDRDGGQNLRVLGTTVSRAGLGPGEQKRFRINAQTPEEVAPGRYYLISRIEQNGSLPVKDSKFTQINLLEPPKPSLQVRILSVSQERPMIGEVIQVRLEVKNTGGAKAARPVLTCGLGDACTGVVLPFKNRELTTVQAGVTRNYRVDYRIPAEVEPGTRYLVATVLDSSGNETALTQGCKEMIIIDGNRPDLTIDIFQTTFHRTEPVTYGQQFAVQWRIRNIGTGTSARGSMNTSFSTALHRGRPIAGGLSWPVPKIPPGATYPANGFLTGTLIVPEKARPGESCYVIGDVALSSGPADVNPENNIRGFPIHIVHLPRPDLIVERLVLDKEVAKPGEKITITFSVQNIGQGAAGDLCSTKLFLSDNATLDSGDLILKSFASPLSFGAAYSNRLHYTVPVNLSPGSYWIVATIDQDNHDAEIIKTNNILMRRLHVVK